MNTEFGFIGWCNEDNHDKIWGYFYRPTPDYDPKQSSWRNPNRNICVFWGRRGKAMQFKGSVEDYDSNRLVDSKKNKGYIQITPEKLIEIWPTFDEEMKLKLSFEVLAGKVK